MQKKTKGIIAGAAGAAILLGTAGTFALWTDEATVPGGSVTGGSFALDASDFDWTWTDISESGTVAEEATDGPFTLVPGVELTGTSLVGIDLDGDHLLAELKTAAGEDAPTWLTVDWTFGGAALTGNAVELTPASTGDDIPLVVTIRLTEQGPGPSEVSGLTWDSDDFVITLTQLAPSLA